MQFSPKITAEVYLLYEMLTWELQAPVCHGVFCFPLLFLIFGFILFTVLLYTINSVFEREILTSMQIESLQEAALVLQGITPVKYLGIVVAW